MHFRALTLASALALLAAPALAGSVRECGPGPKCRSCGTVKLSYRGRPSWQAKDGAGAELRPPQQPR